MAKSETIPCQSVIKVHILDITTNLVKVDEKHYFYIEI